MTARDAADVTLTLIDLGPVTWKTSSTMYEATAPHTQPQTLRSQTTGLLLI